MRKVTAEDEYLFFEIVCLVVISTLISRLTLSQNVVVLKGHTKKLLQLNRILKRARNWTMRSPIKRLSKVLLSSGSVRHMVTRTTSSITGRKTEDQSTHLKLGFVVISR